MLLRNETGPKPDNELVLQQIHSTLHKFVRTISTIQRIVCQAVHSAVLWACVSETAALCTALQIALEWRRFKKGHDILVLLAFQDKHDTSCSGLT